jgi:hypothetical protein
MKYFFCHIPFGRKEVYAKEVMKANLEKLSHLIKVYGFLLQAKVYLFWNSFHSLNGVKVSKFGEVSSQHST